MAATLNPTTLIASSSKPQNPFIERSYFTRTKLYTGGVSSFPRPTLTVKKCINCGRSDSHQSEMGRIFEEVVSGMLDEGIKELLSREENKDLLDGLEKATLRVEMAKRELAEIEKQEAEAKQVRDYINQLQSRATEIAECEREILEARLLVEKAERSLDMDGLGETDVVFTETGSEAVYKDEDRLESIKAACISAVVGTLAGLPISLTRLTSSPQFMLSLGITFVSCALFGVTFRYAIRKDLGNFQLKSGTSAAFSFVKGLATLEGGPPLELDADSLLSHVFDGAVHVSESLLIFAFAAVGLDLCIKMRVLSAFPAERSGPKTVRR